MAGQESPMDYKYMRMVRESLHLMGSWPYAALGTKRRYFPFRNPNFIILLFIYLIIVMSMYVIDNRHKLNFFELGHSYITILMSVVKLVYKEVTKICTVLCAVIHIQVVLGPALFNSTPLINNFRTGMFSSEPPINGTYENSVYYYLPFDYTTNFMGFLIVYIANIILTIDVAMGFLIYDLFLSLIVFHIWGHLKILDHNLRNFPRPALKNQIGDDVMIPRGGFLQNPAWYTPEETKHIQELLKENIQYHRLIKKFVDNTSGAFGFTLLLYLTFHQICGCIMLFECSKLDSAAIGEYGLLTVLSFQQLIQLSVIFELIATRGDGLSDAVYSVPWEYMGTRERKTVLIFLCNVQASSTSLKALGMVPVGVRTMASIIKTSITYCIMLRTMASE